LVGLALVEHQEEDEREKRRADSPRQCLCGVGKCKVALRGEYHDYQKHRQCYQDAPDDFSCGFVSIFHNYLLNCEL